jgi:hypothetical protein
MPSRANRPTFRHVHCNSCRRRTKHAIVATRVLTGSEPVPDHPEESYSWKHDYAMLECLGCETIVMEKVTWFSEWEENELTYFPAPISRSMPVWKDKLEFNTRSLMKEVYAALQADSHSLATMGARALVDMVMNEEVGDVGGFEKKMNAMIDKGIISRTNADVLSAALDAGHAASHRGHRPKAEEVDQIMDIVENLLHSHILKKTADSLRSSTPQRVHVS